jgi:hypothetical protein
VTGGASHEMIREADCAPGRALIAARAARVVRQAGPEPVEPGGELAAAGLCGLRADDRVDLLGHLMDLPVRSVFVLSSNS